MGKYPHSLIHTLFSDWHYTYCDKSAYLTDIDRLWVELRKFKPVAVFDLKTPYEIENFEMPVSERIVKEFFENQDISYYIVEMDISNGLNPRFTLIQNGTIQKLDHNAMIDFINNLGHGGDVFQ